VQRDPLETKELRAQREQELLALRDHQGIRGKPGRRVILELTAQQVQLDRLELGLLARRGQVELRDLQAGPRGPRGLKAILELMGQPDQRDLKAILELMGQPDLKAILEPTVQPDQQGHRAILGLMVQPEPRDLEQQEQLVQLGLMEIPAQQDQQEVREEQPARRDPKVILGLMVQPEPRGWELTERLAQPDPLGLTEQPELRGLVQPEPQDQE
jgi:hypothetical protein